jgi:hypothetical protein
MAASTAIPDIPYLSQDFQLSAARFSSPDFSSSPSPSQDGNNLPQASFHDTLGVPLVQTYTGIHGPVLAIPHQHRDPF